MDLRYKIISGGKDLAIGQVGQHILSFLRNLIVARLISPENFGIAASFAVILSMLEVMSDLGVDRFIVQASDGDDEKLQSTLQFVLIARGLCIGLLMFLSAGSISSLFGVSETYWAFQWLALVPIIKGFTHLDLKRFQRNLTYRPEIISILWSQGLALIVAAFLALWLRSFEAMLWSSLTQACVAAYLSHKFSERPFKIELSRALLTRLLIFGWPLLLNGVLLFATSQGDKVLVGNSLGIKELGIYSAAALVPFAINMFLLKITVDLSLPILSSVKKKSSLFQTHFDTLFAFCGLVVIIFLIPFIFLGHVVFPIMFGAAYSVPAELIAFLTLAVAARVLRAAPTSAALAHGDTKNLLFANTIRISGLLIAFILLQHGWGLSAVAAALAFGEFLATLFAVMRVNILLDYPMFRNFSIVLGIYSFCIVSIIYIAYDDGNSHLFDFISMSTVVSVLGILFLFSISYEIRKQFWDLVAAFFKPRPLEK